MRTIWTEPDDPGAVHIIDQRALPAALVIERLTSLEEAARAIRDMHVRGAGLIGATAAWAMWLAARTNPGALEEAAAVLLATRPTAVNLRWAVERQLTAARGADDLVAAAEATARAVTEEDADACRRIGAHGLPLIEEAARRHPGRPVNILTHCNAGWLAFVDHGSATAPIYAAHDAGIPVHVWVDETRPRCQGSKLTAWELAAHGVPHTIITDNAGGHLMRLGRVDLVIVGADRVTRAGDAANKIGTYLKALAARDNGVPFYVALPSSTFDWGIRDGLREIPIEERGAEEVLFAEGVLGDGSAGAVRLAPPGSAAANFGFDVTPARLITGLITERGICGADEASIVALFPEQAGAAAAGG